MAGRKPNLVFFCEAIYILALGLRQKKGLRSVAFVLFILRMLWLHPWTTTKATVLLTAWPRRAMTCQRTCLGKENKSFITASFVCKEVKLDTICFTLLTRTFSSAGDDYAVCKMTETGAYSVPAETTHSTASDITGASYYVGHFQVANLSF